MFSLSKIATFALLALVPFASAVAQPAPNRAEVASRAAPTTDIVKLLTDTKGSIGVACAQITSSPSTLTAAVISSVAAQVNVTLTATTQALTNNVISGVSGDVREIVGLVSDIIKLLVDTIATVPSAEMQLAAALNGLIALIDKLLAALVIEVISASTSIITGVGASFKALIGCVLQSSGTAGEMADYKLDFALAACGLTSSGTSA
ncbi:unnamed protein product [Peniophora sp. CBMAI 1063]|nr:unnamed protein product [Peniophora sp. CBMAI 1063]